jgi:hypothetical protein
MTDEVRIELKIGNIELEFEGSNQTFESRIEPILKDLIAFGKESFSISAFDENDGDHAAKSKTVILPKTVIPQMTVKSVANKLGADSGGTLLYAAVASLAVVQKKETFSRQEMNDEMKLATGYYKTSYSSNLSNYIDTLSGQGTLIEVSKDTYAVQNSALAAMEQKLAHRG